MATSTVGPGPGGAACIDADFPIRDSTGREYCPMEASYSRDLTGALEFAVPTAQGYAGSRSFVSQPAQFPVYGTTCLPVTSPGTGEERTKCEVRNVAPPSRLYVRAFAETTNGSPLEHRFAFTNPIWMRAPNLPAAPPAMALSHVSCDATSRTNTFRVTVTPPAGTSVTVNKQFNTTGTWQILGGTTFTALENTPIGARAQACTPHGCSGWVARHITSPSCHADPPATPRVQRAVLALQRADEHVPRHHLHHRGRAGHVGDEGIPDRGRRVAAADHDDHQREQRPERVGAGSLVWAGRMQRRQRVRQRPGVRRRRPRAGMIVARRRTPRGCGRRAGALGESR